VVIRFLWPGKTKNKQVRDLQNRYFRKLSRLEKCELIESKEAKGLAERNSRKIKKIEAENLEKHLKDDYIICLSDKGEEMTSLDLARFLEKLALDSHRAAAFVLGGYLGLEDSFVKKADFLLCLSKMTFSHELTRIMLLEQIYRALTLIKGRAYAK